MCGIAGYIDSRTPPAAREEAVRQMCDAMVHRGPDDSGLLTSGSATLGMRRLAVFDPANGHQPMQSPDGRLTLVFNGAIYNFRALRDELAGAWEFRTHCDTEVLLASFARWGEQCVSRLRGMYAFAVWDALEQSLFLARDPFGIKPLYLYETSSRLMFASETNALLASAAVPRELDVQGVADYLAWLSVPAPRTIYRGITSLRPGECASFRDGKLQRRPTWTFDAIPPAEACRSRGEFREQLRTRLEDSVRAHVLADVPVGAFLSGGLDSAAVAGLMTRAGGARLRTFSIGFEETAYSEAGEAAATARHFGTDHHATVVRGADVAGDLERILSALDQPTGDGINTYYASKAAHDGGMVVALSGLGGDELFGGYPSFSHVPRLARWLPLWLRLPSAWRDQIVRRLAAGDTRQRKLADALHFARSARDLNALQRRVFAEADRHALLSGDARAALDAAAPFHPQRDQLSAELADAGAFESISAWELRTYMADVLLRDSDVMSMRHSLELRVPLVDRPLIEWLWRQPAEFKSGGGDPKAILAEALADMLPPHVTRAKKRGFTLPMDGWMRRELRGFLDETFSAESVSRTGMLAPEPAQRLWRDYLARNDARQWSRVWSLAVLIAFANRPKLAMQRSSPERQQVNRSCERQRVDAGGERQQVVSPDVAGPPVAQLQPGFSTSARATRTLFLVPEIFASEGGIPRILQVYLRALCELAGPAGTVRLLALNDAALDPAALRQHANGSLESAAGCGRRKIRFVRTAVRLSRGCDRIVCGHVFLLPVAWLARRLNPRLRYYLVAHGIEVWRPFTLRERLALRGAERIFCVSDYTRRELLRHCALPAGRAVVLPNALGPSVAVEPGEPLANCPPVILVVTRLTYADRYKGVDHLIAAMPAIRAAVPGAKLRIVGRGDDLDRLQRLGARLGLGDAVEFTGYLSDERLAQEMRSCRLFALPSRNEGFGLVFLEAMAKGRPCLGARAGGVPEVITEETGMLIDDGLDGIARATTVALQRDWHQAAILERVQDFLYPRFRDRLGMLLAA